MFQDGSGGGPTDSPLTLCRRARPTSIQGSGRQTRLPSLCQSNVPGKRERPRRRRRLLGPRADRDGRGCNSEQAEAEARLPSSPPSDRPENRSWRSARGKCTRSADVPRPPGECTKCISDPARAPKAFRAEFRGPTLRIHPFTSRRFHVLLNSLFKVLFNFPSRYLFAIGPTSVFSFR